MNQRTLHDKHTQYTPSKDHFGHLYDAHARELHTQSQVHNKKAEKQQNRQDAKHAQNTKTKLTHAHYFHQQTT